MKTPSDELFKLIKSLTPNERRHFKLSVIGSGEKSYMKLFDLIYMQETYDESLIVRQLKNDPILRNLKKWKTYIFEVVLRSLETYHRDDDTESMIERQLQRSRILNNKGLNRQAEQHLKKARTMAADSDNYEYMPVINKLGLQNMIAEPDPVKIKSYLRKEAEKDPGYFDTVKINMGYRNLLLTLMPLALSSSIKKLKENDASLSGIIHHPLMRAVPQGATLTAMHHYHLIRNIILAIRKNWTKRDSILQKKWVAYLETRSTNLKENSTIYLNALNYMIITLAKTDETGRIEHYFIKLLNYVNELPQKKINRSSTALISAIINNYILVQLLLLRADKAIEAWDHMQRTGVHLARSRYANIMLYFNLLYAYFLSGDNRKALHFANKISSDKIFVNKRHRAALNIYLLILHYELNNYDVLPYLARSSRRYLGKTGTLSDYDKLILNYFERKLSKPFDKKEEEKIFIGWRRELLKLPKQSVLYKDKEDFFDFSYWLDSKIERKTFAQVMRSKAKDVN